jgi:hypothetical protein
MQYNMETSERGLKFWAKRASRAAVKHGRDKYIKSTLNRVGKTLLFNTAADCVKRH